MKKLIFMLWFFLFWSLVSNIYAQTSNNEFYYEQGIIGTEINTEYGKLIKEDAINPEDSLLNKLLTVFNLDQPDYHWPQKAFYYIKKILNYALGFVSLIALGLLLYSFYGMLTGDGDKQFGKVKDTLKGIVIAILVMGISWMIVSMLFWFYENQVYTP